LDDKQERLGWMDGFLRASKVEATAALPVVSDTGAADARAVRTSSNKVSFPLAAML